MNHKNIKKKKRTAILSIVSNSVLILMKLVAGAVSGSVSIMSEAIHSGLDLIAAVIAYIAVRVSDKPADKEHPFGHGKYENVSGVIESLLIFVAAIWIIFEAVSKLRHGESSFEGSTLNIGIVVMLISGLVNFLVSRRLYKVAKETGSLALEADALHLKTDVYTSVGVGVGLLAIKLTGYDFLDPIIAIIVALFILSEAYKMLMKAFNPLLDSSIDENEQKEIITFLEARLSHEYCYSDFKTRKSGAKNIVQFKLCADGESVLRDAVNARKELQNSIVEEFPNTELIVLLEAKDARGQCSKDG